MDPGPVPPELKVSYQYAACIEGLSVLIKFLFVGREFLDVIPFTLFVFF